MIKEEQPIKKKTKKKKSSASSKSVETMFRNAYRAQLDMIALAATKANIMISLNGVIVSILMVTVGFIWPIPFVECCLCEKRLTLPGFPSKFRLQWQINKRQEFSRTRIA